MLTKRTVLDQIEITQSGHIQARFRKEVVEDDKVLAFEYHRAVIECGGDCDGQIAAVNAHLKALGCDTVSNADIAAIKKHACAAWTPERLEKASADVDAKVAAVTTKQARLLEQVKLIEAAKVRIEAEEKKLAERIRAIRNAKSAV